MAAAAASSALGMAAADEPPALNPFAKPPSAEREDAIAGYVELSDGSMHPGLIYLTREKRLKIYDDKVQRQREVPLQAVQQIDCTVKKEWIEKEWRFKESANDEKVYTGRSYPTRECLYTITLRDGRTIAGPLSAIVYVRAKPPESAGADQERPQAEPAQFVLHKRDKGELNADLASLVYVKRIKLGDEAYAEGAGRAAARKQPVKGENRNLKAR